jgi:hypothetical protein
MAWCSVKKSTGTTLPFTFLPACYMSRPSHPLHLIILVVSGEEYKLWSSLLCNCHHYPVTSSFSGPNFWGKALTFTVIIACLRDEIRTRCLPNAQLTSLTTDRNLVDGTLRKQSPTHHASTCLYMEWFTDKISVNVFCESWKLISRTGFFSRTTAWEPLSIGCANSINHMWQYWA